MSLGSKVGLEYRIDLHFESINKWIRVHSHKSIIEFEIQSLDAIFVDLYRVLEGKKFTYTDPWHDTLEMRLNGSDIDIRVLDKRDDDRVWREYHRMLTAREYSHFLIGIGELDGWMIGMHTSVRSDTKYIQKI